MKYLIALCVIALPLVSDLEQLPENQPLPLEMFLPLPDGPKPEAPEPSKELWEQ